jgi:hypothetical protein
MGLLWRIIIFPFSIHKCSVLFKIVLPNRDTYLGAPIDFGAPIWDPDLLPRFGTRFWDPNLGGGGYGTSIFSSMKLTLKVTNIIHEY